MHRDWLLVLAALGVAALTAAALALGVEAWAGLYPRSPMLERAAGWPLVGEWVAGVRERHIAPPAPRQPIGARRAPVTAAGRMTEVGSPTPVTLPAGVWPQLWLSPGEALYSSPAAAASVAVTVTTIANVPVLEARGLWRRVRWHGEEGWVRERAADGPPLGSAVEPVRPVSGRAADPELLAAARELLGDAAVTAPARSLGPYPLLSDVEETALLILLDRAAAGVEAAYRARYGLDLAGVPAETVVLFRRRASYEQFLQRTGGPAAESGHVVRGVVALYREGRLIEDVRGTLVHELVHTLGRRGLGPALPPWLDEGMADDLGESRVGAGAAMEPGTISGTTVRSGGFFELHGGEASRELLRREAARGGLLPLQRLVALDEVEFHALRPRAVGYAEASFFIRFLLDGELAAPFRAYLRQLATGAPPTPEALAAALGRSWAELDAGLAEWIRSGPPSPPGTPWPPPSGLPEATPAASTGGP